MLARRILKEKKGELSYKRAYGSFFDFDEENMLDLRDLHGLQICCNGNWQGGELFKRLDGHFSRPEASAQEAEQLLIMLKEVTDHYLLYLAPKAEEQKLSIWAQMLDAFSTVATKQPKPALATSTPRIEQHISLPSPVQSSENRGTWSKKLSSQRVSTARQEEESSYYAPPLPATPSALPSKQEAQILARHIFETQSVPEGYIAFQPILSRRLKNGSMHIIYQDPFDASSDKHIHYLIDKEGKFTIQHGNAAQAIIPVTQHTEHKETGIAIHTICNGHYERQPIARYGTGESLLQGVSLVPKKAATLPPSSQWQAYVSQAQARPSQMMLH